GLFKKITCAEIQELSVIMGSDHELPVARLQLKGIHSGKESDQKIKFDDPRKMERIPNSALEEVRQKNTKTIAKAAIALGKLICKVKQNKISAKCLLVEVWNNQIRRINHLTKTKVNKFPH
ncbi:14914_t:CDS:2, partial [Gigaspora margarita]